jgi:hypothetical protein
MKPRYASILVLCFYTGFVSLPAAQADILATDDFSYPNGPLAGANGGTGWSSVWAESAMYVVNGQAVSNTPGVGQRYFFNPESAAGLFFSVDMTLPAFTLEDYFYVQGGTGANITQISFGKFAGSNRLQVGNGGFTAGGPDLVAGSSLRLIGAYVKNVGAPGDLLMLWINPDGSDYYDIATSAHSADVHRIDFDPFHSRHVSFKVSLPNVAFDNLVISNSPGGVGLGSSAIPEPRMVFPFAALGLATVFMRKRLAVSSSRP